MEDPEYCSICRQRLRPIKHPVGHGGEFHWDAVMLVCPHVVHHSDDYEHVRHDEWHRGPDGSWVNRNST